MKFISVFLFIFIPTTLVAEGEKTASGETFVVDDLVLYEGQCTQVSWDSFGYRKYRILKDDDPGIYCREKGYTSYTSDDLNYKYFRCDYYLKTYLAKGCLALD